MENSCVTVGHYFIFFLVHHDRTVTTGHWAVPQWDQQQPGLAAIRAQGQVTRRTHQRKDIYAAS